MQTICVRQLVQMWSDCPLIWEAVTSSLLPNECFSPSRCSSLLCCVCWPRNSRIWDLIRSRSLWLSRSVSCLKEKEEKNHTHAHWISIKTAKKIMLFKFFRFFFGTNCQLIPLIKNGVKTSALRGQSVITKVFCWMLRSNSPWAMMSNMFGQLEK